MCGIAGVVALRGAEPLSLARLRAMCDTIAHRGPDDSGLDVRDGVALGMRRLAIIDVAGGRQPLHNEDDTIRAVFNGEIYNFRELRRGLEAAGHRFASATDGEVLSHLYEERGAGFVGPLNGMFAIALHDGPGARVILARDRIGIKPLFYAMTPDHLVFGSEIKALLASGLVPRDGDTDALGQFVAWEYVPGPATLFAGIRKLEPGAILAIDLRQGAVATSRYWDLPGAGAAPSATPEPPRADAEWEERVDAALAEAVRRQLVSDVPLGAFLSGGVDSSIVVGGMGAARTFSIGFGDPSYNESRYAAEVARHLGVSHRIETLEPDLTDLFQRLMHYMDDPIGDFSIFPTYLVSKLAREEVTVALTGDGGDELFGGYETYVAQERARLWRRIPRWLRAGLVDRLVRVLPPRPEKKGLVNKLKRFTEGFGHDERLRHARWRLFAGETLQRELFTPEALSRMTPVEHHILELSDRAGRRGDLDRQLYVDLKSYLVDNCLVKVDRMSMACSLEARVPFLDDDVVDLAFRLPEHLKVRGGATKVLLKRVAARHVPRECVYRPKEGFSIPIKQWLGVELRPLMEDLLDPRALGRDGVLRPETVARLKQEHLAGRANHSHVLWTLMVYREWQRRWAA